MSFVQNKSQVFSRLSINRVVVIINFFVLHLVCCVFLVKQVFWGVDGEYFLIGKFKVEFVQTLFCALHSNVENALLCSSKTIITHKIIFALKFFILTKLFV